MEPFNQKRTILSVGKRCKPKDNIKQEQQIIHRVFDPSVIPKKECHLDIIVTFLLEPCYKTNDIKMAIAKTLRIFPNADIIIADKTGEQNLDKIKSDFEDTENIEIVDINSGFIPAP